MSIQFTINTSSNYQGTLDTNASLKSTYRYEVDVSLEEFLAKAYSFEELNAHDSDIENEYEIKERDLLIRERNGEPWILVLNDSDIARLDIVVWEQLIGKEITPISNNDPRYGRSPHSTTLLLHYSPSGTNLDPEGISADEIQRFNVSRNPWAVFLKLVSLHPMYREYEVYMEDSLDSSEVLIVIPHDSQLASQGIPYWEKVFAVHGGLKKLP